MKSFFRRTIAVMCIAAMMVTGSSGAFAADTAGAKMPADGTYKAATFINSSMMNVAAEDNSICTVTVKDGKAVAHLRLNGDGYEKLFVGTKAEAEKNKDESKCIPYTVDEAGRYVYDVPIENFDEVFDLAAFSKARQKWYDRQAVFYLGAPEKTVITSAKTADKAMSITWAKKTNYVTGYQVRVSDTEDFSDPEMYILQEINGNANNNYVLKNLKANTKKYFQVRTVRTVKVPFDDPSTEYAYSEWTPVKKVTTLSKITPTTLKTVTSPAKKTLNVTWTKKTANVTGYQVMYSTSSNFNNAKTVTVTKNTTTSKKLTKLTSGKKYYVKVRTYQEIGGTKYPSAWSPKKSVKVK